MHKNLESAEFPYNKNWKPTLHSLIANHVLEMSVKLKSKCVRLTRNIALFWWFESVSYICFYQGLFTKCDLDHMILLYYYGETKGTINDESVNLKGAVYEPKQNSFNLQSVSTGFTNVGSIFYKVRSLSSEQVFN